MPEKNLGILRSRGPLPHVKRRVLTSGALVDASTNLFFAPRASFAGSLEDLSGPLRLPSESLSIARVARATKVREPGVISVRWQGSLACSIGFEGLTTRGSSLFHLFRIHNISFREQAHVVAHLVSPLDRDGYRVGILIFSLDLTGREWESSPLFSAAADFFCLNAFSRSSISARNEGWKNNSGKKPSDAFLMKNFLNRKTLPRTCAIYFLNYVDIKLLKNFIMLKYI